MRSPYVSIGSDMALASFLGIGATVPDSTEGLTTSFFSGGVAGGVGGASCFLLSSDPICRFPLYFLSMPSLWYFQNCFEASLPATLCKTIDRLLFWSHKREGLRQHTLLTTCQSQLPFTIRGVTIAHLDARLETWSGRRRRCQQ